MKNISIIFALLMIFGSCTMKNNEKLKEEINTNIDSLKNIYAPDKRITLWNVTTDIANDTLVISAELENKTAADQLKEILTKKYPDVLLKIKILPEKEQERTVHAIVNNSVASIRKKAKHSSELVNQAFLGTPVKVYKKERNWYLIQTPNRYIGWINEDDIIFFNKEQLSKLKQKNKIIYKKQQGSSYSEPDENSQVISDLVIGCILSVTDTINNFFKVQYPDGREAYVLKKEVDKMMTVFNRIPEGKNLVNTAKKFYGIPYLWGGLSSKAIDCSGFTSAIYFMNGVILQRDASQQIKYGTEMTNKFKFKNLSAGDLLFFTDISYLGDKEKSKKITHVGMYIGDTEFIHASGKVKINSMDSTRKNFNPEYRDTFKKAIRIIGNVGTESIEKITDNKFYKTIIPNRKK
ncbi:MAG: hypothetical protein DRI94_04590 [Bacteroidetes bacterium]|nr:MAG: hypothetical protein DRI94_04590 [Bacteroidota bacterium]